MSKLKPVDLVVNFPMEEEKILEFWDRIDAFRTSVKMSEGKPKYSFYDGPPFATGLPHYGHILAGTIKDTVTRYAHQTGHHVERRFGWDCHGLPIEFEIEQKLGIKTKEDVLKFGIANYNRECRSIVMRFSKEWERVVKRVGRWIDFENDYKTMNIEYMESVWWVFRQLFDKGLVYRGNKVMPYSVGCTTPLSNFEANMNYQDVHDPAVIITFPLEEEPETSLLAWTTTPWTLPSNVALVVNPHMIYVKIRDSASMKVWIVAESRLIELYKNPKKAEYEILEKMEGKTLVGKKYIPLFDCFRHIETAFRVIDDEYVTSDSGTGVVHAAPGFGEDDYRVCVKHNIVPRDKVPCPLDANGFFTEEVPDFTGMFIKDADKPIIAYLKEHGRLVHSGTVVHSYPFCWRSDTPLIYRTIPSWFVGVEDIKKELLETTKETYWVPSFVKDKRFQNWLEDAHDWAVSRNRYWGTPIPLWVSDDYEEVVCIGSIAELEELSGCKLTDIHREFVDDITIPSKQGKGVLRRIPEVFDCWFESGSMPYAQRHYPFESQDVFEETFPADFIAEGLDQTRGWFYTLMVLSTALFGKPAFKNLIVNGLVLAADGKKMSKRLKNYPDPSDVINDYGADALRVYLINSPVVRAEPLRFKIDGVRDVIRDVVLPWFNAYRFFVQNVHRYEKTSRESFEPLTRLRSENIMDQWILASIQSLLKFFATEMDAYRLYTVMPRLLKFLDDLTNWYVRMNRPRLKGNGGSEDTKTALSTLFEVLLTMCKVMAPFTPFLVEMMYQNLKNIIPSEEEQEESVHFMMIPKPKEEYFNEKVERMVERLQTVVQLGRQIRDRNKVPLKKPLKRCVVVNANKEFVEDVSNLESYLLQELNVTNIEFTSDEMEFVQYRIEPEYRLLGRRLGKKLKDVVKKMKDVTQEQIHEAMKVNELIIGTEKLTLEEVKVIRDTSDRHKELRALSDGQAVVLLDMTEDAELSNLFFVRELVSSVQKLRKQAGLVITDEIEVLVDYKEKKNGPELVMKQEKMVRDALRLRIYEMDAFVPGMKEIKRELVELSSGDSVEVALFNRRCLLQPSLLEKSPSLDALISEMEYDDLRTTLMEDGELTIVDAKDVEWKLVDGKDVFVDLEAFLKASQQ
eukprot:TRINITY_DN2462_c0_g1_i1.p1 TRINITY_DN2462_c0_g1~~TRINITY_DN2462_c0_g1_i1.p1  ORF type:complete len:1134 (+),score=319.59 TRINITY_DN2462_c0_g1_i1:134-3535(+)